jgi:hypothetical protein
MFYVEEDILPAVKAATEIFGPAGQFAEGKNVMRNVFLATRQFGKIWYGDVDTATTELATKCKELAQKIDQTIYVFSSSNEFEYNTATKFAA